ncbi:MAG: FxLYD domain-containing protein [Clostridia bacterium]
MKAKKRRIVIWIVLLATAIVASATWILIQKKEKQTAGTITNTVKEEFVDVLEDGTKLNNSTKLAETKTFNGMEISQFQLTEKDNVSILLGTITNTSDTVKGGYPITIQILDKADNEIITVGGFIGELQPGQSTQLSISATFDYANAYDFVIHQK